MTIEEKPVLVPSTVLQDTFFFSRTNRAILDGNRGGDVFDVFPKKVHYGSTVLTFMLSVVSAILLGTWVHSELFLIVLFFGGCLMIATTITSAADYAQKLYQRYQKEGYVVPGEILACVGSTGHLSLQYSTRSFVLQVQYQFTTPGGKVIRASLTEPRSDWNEAALPTPGTPVYVLYFNDREYYLL
jgi:hypothetical protein